MSGVGYAFVPANNGAFDGEHDLVASVGLIAAHFGVASQGTVSSPVVAFAALRRWYRYRTTVVALRNLELRILRDTALDRSDVHIVAKTLSGKSRGARL